MILVSFVCPFGVRGPGLSPLGGGFSGFGFRSGEAIGGWPCGVSRGRFGVPWGSWGLAAVDVRRFDVKDSPSGLST